MNNAIAVLGGSFNPLHVGHLRIALEAREALEISRVALIPCASPPHKSGRGLLPFDLRRLMLERSIAHLPGFAVDCLEAERPGPSYTVDTLAELRRRMPDTPLLFILGGNDFLTFEHWRRYEELPDLADLVVLPRDGAQAEEFRRKAQALWPTLRRCDPPAGAQEAWELPPGGRLLYVPQPRLDISSTLVRERFLAGRTVDFLVPAPVSEILEENRDAIRALWGAGDSGRESA